MAAIWETSITSAGSISRKRATARESASSKNICSKQEVTMRWKTSGRWLSIWFKNTLTPSANSWEAPLLRQEAQNSIDAVLFSRIWGSIADTSRMVSSTLVTPAHLSWKCWGKSVLFCRMSRWAHASLSELPYSEASHSLSAMEALHLAFRLKRHSELLLHCSWECRCSWLATNAEWLMLDNILRISGDRASGGIVADGMMQTVELNLGLVYKVPERPCGLSVRTAIFGELDDWTVCWRAENVFSTEYGKQVVSLCLSRGVEIVVSSWFLNPRRTA